MIIQTKNQNGYVFGIYWIDKVRHYYYLSIPYDGNGIDVVTEKKCDIIDPLIGSDFVLLKSDYSGTDLLLHRALAEDKLLDSVIENDAEAMAEFARRIKIDYLKDKNVYRYPPLDMLCCSETYPTAPETEGSYQFCPKCYEGNIKANPYDEAIKCSNCETLYNCLELRVPDRVDRVPGTVTDLSVLVRAF